VTKKDQFYGKVTNNVTEIVLSDKKMIKVIYYYGNHLVSFLLRQTKVFGALPCKKVIYGVHIWFIWCHTWDSWCHIWLLYLDEVPYMVPCMVPYMMWNL